MPIYEYHCNDCDRDFEELVFSEGQEVKCPFCSSEKTEKLMSACKFKTGGGGSDPFPSSSGSSSSSSCSGCTGGNCSTCG